MRSTTFISALFALFVLGALGVVTLADLFDGPGSARQERVAQTPDLPNGLSGLPRFLAQARFYVGERYALKDQFVTWNGAVELNAFRHSPASSVALGEDGFLFLTGQGTVEIAQGRNRLSGPAQSHWMQSFARIQGAFSEADMIYGLLIGPNKHTVYPDRLPSWLSSAPIDETRTADVIGALTSSFGPEYTDPRKLLLSAREANPDVSLYHPTDTHWTEWGAALAVHDRLRAMGLELEAPRFDVAPMPYGGDLSRMIGQQGSMSEAAPVLPDDWSCRDANGTEFYVVTIDPLMPRRFTCGSPLGRPERLVVFTDSFGVPAIPYLAARFEQVEFIWSDAADPTAAAALDADYVLQILVERKLRTDTPEQFFMSQDAVK